MPPTDIQHYINTLDDMEKVLRRKRAPLSVIRSVVEASLAVAWLEQQAAKRGR